MMDDTRVYEAYTALCDTSNEFEYIPMSPFLLLSACSVVLVSSFS